jgi:hypothetical protein
MITNYLNLTGVRYLSGLENPENHCNLGINFTQVLIADSFIY